MTSSVNARAILFTGINQVAVGPVEIPEPGEGEVLIQASFTGISPGSELRCLAGKQRDMPAWPFIPGYSMTGKVVRCGRGVTLPEGTPVLCSGTLRAGASRLWGGHVSHGVQPASRVVPLPDGVDLEEAAIAPLAAIALHGVRVSRPAPLEKVAVIGLGPVGQLSARLHALFGADVVGADLSPVRAKLLADAGVNAIVPTSSLAEAFKSVFPDGANLVVDATGASAVLAQAIEVARLPGWENPVGPGPRLLVQGSYPVEFTVPYGAAFSRELTILMTRDRQPQDSRDVIRLLKQQRLKMRDLISAVRPPEAAPEIYAGLQAGKDDLMTAVFRWSAG